MANGKFKHIPTANVSVPDKLKRRPPNKKDEKILAFIDSVKRSGFIHPIVVRDSGDGQYELATGRTRLWIAVYLELPEIPAKVMPASTTDDEMHLAAGYENFLRGHMGAAELAKLYQVVLRDYERVHGVDPGKSVGGKARAKTANRDPQSGKVRKGQKDDDPASEATSLAGEDASPSEPEKSFSTRASESTGATKRSAQINQKIARNLTPDQLTALGLVEATQAELTSLAKIEEDPIRDAAVNIAASGMKISEAIKQAKGSVADPNDGPPMVPEEEVSDKDFLDVICAPVRSQLQNSAVYDRDAILYRRDLDARVDHRIKSKKDIMEAKAPGYSPLSNIIFKALYVDHPREWKVCSDCLGKNVDNPNCQPCVGAGFIPKFTAPRKK